MTAELEIPDFHRRTNPQGQTPMMQAAEPTAKKARTPKRDALECRFSGVIRLPINAADTKTIDAANAELKAKLEAIEKIIGAGSVISADAPKFGKMDLAQ